MGNNKFGLGQQSFDIHLSRFQKVLAALLPMAEGLAACCRPIPSISRKVIYPPSFFDRLARAFSTALSRGHFQTDRPRFRPEQSCQLTKHKLGWPTFYEANGGLFY
jgi:hypothetical protein